MRRLRRSLRSSGLVRRIVRPLSGDRLRRVRRTAEEVRARGPAWHADERTMRRVAEAEHGGLSSEESAARFARHENPGGTHGKAPVREEGPPHERPEQEEPQERVERVPGGERRLRATRRG
ncbi:MAG: hypothetical protein IT372_16830 [Polyangiaceae bacterium]|nr:hypothetical protein [Polyangiaceae bacterium]